MQNAKETLSVQEKSEPHYFSMIGTAAANLFNMDSGNDLVQCGVDMSELSDYLDNIIKVVNQHAKLLD